MLAFVVKPAVGVWITIAGGVESTIRITFSAALDCCPKPSVATTRSAFAPAAVLIVNA